MRSLEIEELDRMFMMEYLKCAEQLTDSRKQEEVKHLLKGIAGIVFFAVLAGNDEWTEISDFAADEKKTLERYWELPNGIPPHDTIQRVFFILRPDELQSMLANMLIQLISIAGKELDEYLTGMTVWAVISGMSLQQTGKKPAILQKRKERTRNPDGTSMSLT